MNFTGVHNDWEAHGDVGVDAYAFYEFWGTVAKRLHPHGRRVGTCVETAPSNISHPWTPRTLNNDTIWHSYMFRCPISLLLFPQCVSNQRCRCGLRYMLRLAAR